MYINRIRLVIHVFKDKKVVLIQLNKWTNEQMNEHSVFVVNRGSRFVFAYGDGILLIIAFSVSPANPMMFIHRI